MTIKKAFTGTAKEMDVLHSNFNVRYFVRADIDRYIVEIRVNNDFKIGKISSLKTLINRLKKQRD